jgi:hypothetical protein
MNPKAPGMPHTHCYFLRVSLDEVKPAIWREFAVPSSITLDLLHDMLQVILGWEDYHLHEFTFGERRFTEDPEEPDQGEEEWGAVLSTLVGKTKQKFSYAYDFGDGWHHTITVERISQVPADHYVEISCLAGKRACPPEDVGGPSGYASYRKAMARRRHPDHEDMLRWRGEFDSERFDRVEVNAELAKLLRWARGREH